MSFGRHPRTLVWGTAACSLCLLWADPVGPSVQAQEAQPKARSAAPGKGQRPRAGESARPAAKTAAKPGAKKESGEASRTREATGGAPEAGKPAAGAVSFQRDVAPILVGNCVDCHGGRRPGLARGKLDLGSFARLMEGTPRRKVIVPGKPEESHLVKRLRGDEQPQMPQGENVLSEEAIGKIETWIKEGAKPDTGLDLRAALKSFAASPDQVRRARLAKLSPAEREKLIETTGRGRWKKANPALSPNVNKSEHFVLFSNLPRDRAVNAVKAMELQYNHLKRWLGNPATEWVEKVSLYVFNDPRDLVEFARTIKDPQIDAGVVSAGDFTIDQPYVAVADPLRGGKDDSASTRRRPRGKRAEAKEAVPESDRTLVGLLSEEVGEQTVAAEGKAPRWLALGLGAYLGSLAEPRGHYAQKLRVHAFDAFKEGWDTRASAVLTEGDTVAEGDVRAIGFAMVEFLMRPDLRPVFPAFARRASTGSGKLEDALKQVFNADQDAFLVQTREWVATQYGHDE